MKKSIKNYLARLQENDKKGFSLVELIIVMAIMAILVGIVASQVIPYMEKSRQSKDQQQLSSIQSSLVSAIAQDSDWDQSASAPTTAFALSDLASKTSQTIEDTFVDLCGGTAISGVVSSYTGKFKSNKAKAPGNDIYVQLYANGTIRVWVGASGSTGGVTAKLETESE